MMRRYLSLLTMFALILASDAAGAALFAKPKVIFRKGPDTWVKIVKANKRLVPLEHPRAVTAEEMDRVLVSINYLQPGMFAVGSRKGEVEPLFSELDRKLIAGPLAQALSQAGTDEWVDFSVTTFHGPNLLGNFLQTDGVLFQKDGKLNIALRNIAAKTEPGQTLATFDPTRGYRSTIKLTAGDRQELKADNWIVLDLNNLPEIAPAPGAAPPPATVKERLLQLDELKKAGLVTEEEYQQKRAEILKDL